VVVAHQRGHIEGDAQASLAVIEQVAEAGVGFLGGPEAGEDADRPRLPSVARRVDAAGERVLAGIPEIVRVVEPVVGKVGRSVQPIDRLR